MSRATITAVAITDTGYNLTDSAGFTTMSTGAGNGVAFAQSGSDRIILKNDTGGAAVFTVKVPTPSGYTALGLTIPDMTVTVANGKTWVLEPHSLFRQSDGAIYIDCDVAGKILVLA